MIDMKNKCKYIALFILVLLICGCLDHRDHREEPRFGFNIWFIDAEGEYILFPVVVNISNDMVFSINDIQI